MIPRNDVDVAVAAIAISASGPLLGDYVVIILFGILGALASLSIKAPSDENSGIPKTWIEAITFTAGTVGLSLAGAWIVAVAMSAMYPTFTANQLLGFVSFFIALFARRIMRLAPAILERFWTGKKP